MSTLGQWEFTSDREATIAAYAHTERGGSALCSCNGCRNFSAVRNLVYPSTFLSLLDSLGIDPEKDAEVYHNGKLGPGHHSYGGWFHFVGTLEKSGDFPMVAMSEHFEVWLANNHAPSLESLKRLPLVMIEFHATGVPWVLHELEAI